MLVTELWSGLPGRFFCISTKSGSGKWKDNFFEPSEFGKIRQFLKDNSDKDIYFCPHGFNRRVRQTAEAVLPDLLWADLDYSDPRKIVPKPTIAIESSPGRYVGVWKINGPMTDSLNRRLSYKVGADKGGWDITQVLRFPGTRNYKYKSQPKVRVLWDDGPKWTMKGIEKLLPDEDPESDFGKISPKEVFEKYQSSMPSWLRRELLAKKITGRVDRSEMLWKIENECIESGLTIEEAFAVIKASVWNKFAGRRSEDEQLKRELEKAVDHHFKERGPGIDKIKRDSDEDEKEKHLNGHRFTFKPMSEVELEKMDYIWEPYLARGEVTIIEGDPGLGKSYLAQMIAGAISKGKRLPSAKKGERKVSKGAVVYFDIENSGGTVTKPRLEDNGFTDMTNYYQMEEAFTIDDDESLDTILTNMDDILKKHDEGIGLVVFDTLNTYIGRADTHKASETTQAFSIFKKIAQAYQCSVVVLRHLTKGGGAAMYRGQGSIAFSGSARVVISVGVDPNDTETRAMAITKINFAKAPPALTFRIEERPKKKSEFIWGEYVNLTSQEIMDAATESRKEGKVGDGIQEAMEFLENELTGKPTEVSKLYRMAEKRSIPKKMIDRAMGRMKIVKGRFNGADTWEIKKKAPKK